MNPRKIEPYIRLLELVSQISEDWGKTVREINEYLGKGNDPKALEKALEELRDMTSPILELEGLLEVTLRKADQ